jgi:hypothetical protein
MKQKNDLATAAIFGVALVWGVWTWAPVIVGAIAAVLLVVASGIEAFRISTWAWAVGAACAAYSGILMPLMKPSTRARFADKLKLAAKTACVLFLAAGSLTFLATSMPPVGLNGPLRQVESNVAQAQAAIITVYAWIVIVLIPAVIAVLASVTVFRRTSQ